MFLVVHFKIEETSQISEGFIYFNRWNDNNNNNNNNKNNNNNNNNNNNKDPEKGVRIMNKGFPVSPWLFVITRLTDVVTAIQAA